MIYIAIIIIMGIFILLAVFALHLNKLMPACIVAVFAILTIISGLKYIPEYNVWKRELDGKAQLRQAEWNRQITIKEAEAELEAAKSLSKAEVERAKGASEANKIVANGLGGHEGYLRYLYIQTLAKIQDKSTVIYVPTEAGLPILEAGKR
jgi:hypothetical protein